jgi:hypothetical protein
MDQVRRQTLRLPDDLRVTILRLPHGLTARALKGMLNAELYLLAGDTTTSTGAPSGFGCYVGTSDALRTRSDRAGVSLHTWTTRLGRLRPKVLVLVERPHRPIGLQPRLLVEAALARAISGAHFTVLNTRTAAPTAAQRATRRERLWAFRISDRLAKLIHGRVFFGHAPQAAGGSTREQLVRLVLQHDTPMSVDDLLHAAASAGINIAGNTPAQRTRRDVTTREHDSGRPRLYRTHLDRRTVVYPAHMSLTTARREYQARQRGLNSAGAATGGTDAH